MSAGEQASSGTARATRRMVISRREVILSKYATVLGLAVLILVFSLVAERFTEPTNMINILRQISMLTIVGVGLTFCLAAGDFDLSVGSVAGLAGILTTGLLVKQVSLPVAFLAGISAGMAFGLFNGVIITKLRIPSLITTLGTGSIALGITFTYSKGRAIYGGLPETYAFLGRGEVAGIPTPVTVMVFVVAVAYFLLNRTKVGRYLYAIGGNPLAARLAGINIDGYRILGLLISSLGASLAGILLAARLGSGQPTAGAAYLLDGLAAVFLGMTTIRPGQPNIVGTVIGALIIGIMNNGLNLLGFQYYYQDMAKGGIMIAAVALAASRTRLKFF